MYLLTYHNLDADPSTYLFNELADACKYAMDEIRHFDEEEGTMKIDEDNDTIFITSPTNEAGYTITKPEINPTFTP